MVSRDKDCVRDAYFSTFFFLLISVLIPLIFLFFIFLIWSYSNATNLFANKVYIKSLSSRGRIAIKKKFSDEFTRWSISGWNFVGPIRLVIFFLPSITSESWRSKHTRIRRDSRHYRAVKELVLLTPSFFFSFFCFFFRNSMLSVRVRVSRFRLSSTSHYVRAKKISREFHISPSSRVFLHHRLSFPPLFSEIASTLRSLSALNRQERSMANRVANGSYANLKLL